MRPSRRRAGPCSSSARPETPRRAMRRRERTNCGARSSARDRRQTMRLRMVTMALAGSLIGCAGEKPPPQVEVVRVTPPEVVTRCPAGPDVPTLPGLLPGATVPRTTVAERDRVTGAFIAGLAGAHATCMANAEALRRFFGFGKAPGAPAGAPPAAPFPPA